MRTNGKHRTRGASLVEFTLVGISMVFLLISTIEIARGMWQYHTLAYAIKAGARYAVVHGQDCTIAPNTCTVTISQIASVIRRAGIGLPDSALTVTFAAASGGNTTCLLRDCIANNTSGYWPPSGSNSPGQNLKISGIYPFRSVMIMFWPGVGTNRTAGEFRFSATSRESIQF